MAKVMVSLPDDLLRAVDIEGAPGNHPKRVLA
jgi:hypothetical protein